MTRKGGESALQREIRQNRPFRSRRQEAMLGLLKTADILRRFLATVVEPHGITLQQYNVLRILKGAGPGGLPTLEIADRLIEQAPGVTRLLDRLERKGLVKRERCPVDRRQVTCRITPEGRRLLATMGRSMESADDRCLAMLPVREVERLVVALDVVRAGHGAPRERNGQDKEIRE
jgi:MarR family transcriptional regulator, organic hydroperoxide resistance regulator